MNCPNCKKEITLKKEDIKLHKHGRKAECPKCGRGIILTRPYKGPSKKTVRMSKKDRLKARRS